MSEEQETPTTEEVSNPKQVIEEFKAQMSSLAFSIVGTNSPESFEERIRQAGRKTRRFLTRANGFKSSEDKWIGVKRTNIGRKSKKKRAKANAKCTAYKGKK